MTYTPPRQVVGELRAPPHRPVWIARSSDTLRCGPHPSDHRLKDPLVWVEGCIPCTHEGPDGRRDCPHLIYLIGGGLVTPRSQNIVILTHVTPAEAQHMKGSRMDWEAAVAYLGIGLLP